MSTWTDKAEPRAHYILNNPLMLSYVHAKRLCAERSDKGERAKQSAIGVWPERDDVSGLEV